LQVNKGKMNLDSCISRYLPCNLPLMEYKGKPITLRMLSNHTSGIPPLPVNFATVKDYQTEDPYKNYTQQMLLDYFKQFIPYSEPGKVYGYSNMAVGLLGTILEQQQNKTYNQLVRQQVCKTMKLTQTSQFSSELNNVQRTACYNGVGDSVLPWNFQAFAAAGALHSTAEDMMRYAAFVMNSNQSELSKAVQLTLQPDFQVSEQLQVGLGWYIYQEGGHTWYTHSGGTGGYKSTLVIDAVTQRAVVILCNSANEVEGPAFELLEYLNR
jgi:CubicO group peptidase (beta-lactamase class C family)